MKTSLIIIFILCISMICNSQNKFIELDLRDSSSYAYHQEFIKKFKLSDLTKSHDSLYLRMTTSSISIINKFYELRLKDGNWYGRMVEYETKTYPIWGFTFNLFNHRFHSLSKRNKIYYHAYQQRFFLDTTINHYNSDTLFNLIRKLDHVGNQNDIDTSNQIVNDGVQYNIEISTPTTYKYISWSNPNYASESTCRKTILDFIDFLTHSMSININEDAKKFDRNYWP